MCKKARKFWKQMHTLIHKFLNVKVELKQDTFLLRLKDKQLEKDMELCFHI